MLETIFAIMGAIVGFGTCAILSALKDKPKQIDVSKELEHLTDQVYGCKNRIDNMEMHNTMEHSKIMCRLGEMNRIVINLMQCLDKINNNCIVVGATNRIDMIDKALLRRFTNKYEIKKPTEDFKKEIVRAFLKTIPNNCPESDIDKFVSKGETCAEITNLLINRTVECLVKKQELTLREAQDE